MAFPSLETVTSPSVLTDAEGMKPDEAVTRPVDEVHGSFTSDGVADRYIDRSGKARLLSEHSSLNDVLRALLED